MDNLEIYNKVRTVPAEAQKTISGGRLSGKTDINPMWRLKTLTEVFGVCGFGWRYEITRQWTEQGGDGEVSAFVNINLYVKMNDTWSEAIPGTGGSSYIAKEKAGLYTSDECFKMALTDAISVACKALGFGADVYWQKDTNKYSAQPAPTQQPAQPSKQIAIPAAQSDLASVMEQAHRESDAAKTLDELQAVWNKYKELQSHDTFKIKVTNRKAQLTIKKAA